MTSAIEAQAAEIQTLNGSVLDLTPDRGAIFQPDSKGFQVVHTDYGVFLISLVDVKPYANGYKVVLDLGNAMAVDFDGAELEVRWGPARPKQFTKENSFADWNKQFTSTKQTISRKLVTRSWNPVELILAPATANNIGQIEVTSISTKRVLMIQNR